MEYFEEELLIFNDIHHVQRWCLLPDFITFVFQRDNNKIAIYMEINGKIVQVMAEQSGNGRNGVWRKKDYILETDGNYPKKVALAVWGDKIDQFNLQQGDQVNAGIEIESREYNGKWYTDVKVWKVDRQGAAAVNPQSQSNSAMPDVTSFSSDEGDVLPF
jgi:hypothetical protein